MLLWFVMGLSAGCALGHTTHTEQTGGFEVSRSILEGVCRLEAGGRFRIFGGMNLRRTLDRIRQGTGIREERRRPYQISLGVGWQHGTAPVSRMGFRYRSPWGDSLREKEMFLQITRPGVGFLMAAVEGPAYHYGVIRTFFLHEGRFGPLTLGIRWVSEIYTGTAVQGSGLFFAPYLRWTRKGWTLELELARPGWEGPVGFPIYTSSEGLLDGFFWGIRTALAWRTPPTS